MKNDMRDIRYRIGDMMGDYAPHSMRRSSSTAEWLIGIGSVVAAAGISYIALRLADRRLEDVIRSIVPQYASSNGHERPMVHGTRGARMPSTASMDGQEERTSVGRQTASGLEGGMMPGERSQSRS